MRYNGFDWGFVDLFANERQTAIVELIRRNGAVTTGELMERFGVSIETVRRDLLVMEKKQLLQRVHGGAVALGVIMSPKLDLAHRTGENDQGKRELSVNACSLISDGDIIALDTGSTAVIMAQELRERFSSLTVVTHSLDVFNLLSNFKEFRVILCGGYFLPEENSFYGQLTLDMLSKLHVSRLFLFPSAISLHHGICGYFEKLYQVQLKMLGCADSVCVLADSSKFEKTALLKIDDMSPKYTYITDSALPVELKQLYIENDLRIITSSEDI